MLFNSWVFVVFAVVVFAVVPWLRTRSRSLFLLGASYLFYGYWDWRFLSLIFASTAVDWWVAQRIEATPAPAVRRRWLWASAVVNLGLLAVFKYFGFFVDSAVEVAHWCGLEWTAPALHVVLPVGISFYTFQTLSYTVDVYRGTQAAERSFLDFALYVSFFPQLVAGPIERAGALLPQLQQEAVVTAEDRRVGAWLILQGFFLKIVVADNLAVCVDGVFGPYTRLDAPMALAGVYAFAFQIYGDFAGYSNIARGLARCLGIRLRQNFDVPYRSQNPSEFWRRWHISLSTWLRDYLYIPLGGSRHGARRTAFALLATMGLGGLWHGAAWTFVWWGVFHGTILVLHRALFRGRPPSSSRLRAVLACFVTFQMVSFGWLLFRAKSMAQVGEFLGVLLHGPWRPSAEALDVVAGLCLFGGLTWALDGWTRGRDDPAEYPAWSGAGWVVCTAMLLALVVLAPTRTGNFLYFQF